MGKLIKRIQRSRLLISSLPGSASRLHVESGGRASRFNKHSQSLGSQNLVLDFESQVFTSHQQLFSYVGTGLPGLTQY